MPNLTRFTKIFALLCVITAIIILIYAVVFSGYFKLKNINFQDENFETQTLSTLIRKSLATSLNKSLFFTDLETLQTKILEDFPEIETVKIEKDYPNSIVIEFLEYPLVANIINESSSLKKSYVINSIGYSIKEDFENPNLPYIRVKSDEPINTKNAVIESKKLEYILNAKAYFEDKFGMKVKEIIYKPIAREIHLLTEKDFYIWLDIQVKAENQLKKLKKALVKLDIYKEKFAYIDLRIAGGTGDKIIYKRAP